MKVTRSALLRPELYYLRILMKDIIARIFDFLDQIIVYDLHADVPVKSKKITSFIVIEKIITVSFEPIIHISSYKQNKENS